MSLADSIRHLPVATLDPRRRGYFAGMALGAPFAACCLPYPWLGLGMLLALPLALLLASGRGRVAELREVPGILWVALLLVVSHSYALLTSYTPFAPRILLDIGIVAAVALVFLLGSDPRRPEQLLRGFLDALIPFVVVAATVGVIKAGLLERGITLDFLAKLYPKGSYPAGSALRSDYNLFGLPLVVAGLGLVVRGAGPNLGRWTASAHLLALAMLLAAVWLLGSRRVIILALLIPLLWLSIVIFSGTWARIVKHAVPQLAIVCCVAFAIVHVAGNPDTLRSYGDFLFERGKIAWGVATPDSGAAKPPSAEPLATNSATPQTLGPPISVERAPPAGSSLVYVLPKTILGTIESATAYGFDSRVGRWELSLELLSRAWLLGIGFSYHEIFSCRFLACSGLDYPHMPLLSEWLISGIPGLLSGLAAYAFVLLALARSGREGWLTGSSAVVLVVLPYTMISGDTLLSWPYLFVAGLLCPGARTYSLATANTDKMARG